MASIVHEAHPPAVKFTRILRSAHYNSFPVMKIDIDNLIQALGLIPHPVEGGFYRETYRSAGEIPGEVLPADYEGARHYSTAIYYLLTPETFSEMHRLPTDELFHFYIGDCVEMLHLYADGSSRRVVLGPDLMAGEHVQIIVPAGVWQGCRLRPGGAFALLGCTVAPGFDFRDYVRGRRDDLLRQYPAEAERILQLTRESEGDD